MNGYEYVTRSLILFPPIELEVSYRQNISARSVGWAEKLSIRQTFPVALARSEPLTELKLVEKQYPFTLLSAIKSLLNPGNVCEFRLWLIVLNVSA
jgi:hypothetical protein